MDFKNLIKELTESGVTQKEIASFCGTVQGHISDLKVGRRICPNWIIGDKLIRLHKKKCKKRK